MTVDRHIVLATEKKWNLAKILRSMSPTERKMQGITIAAAKYSSEDAAVLVEYTVAIVEYTRLYKPYRKASDYLQDLLREQEEDEKQAEIDRTAKDQEKEKVRSNDYGDLLCICFFIPRFEYMQFIYSSFHLHFYHEPI